jgi:hypothetical protein
VDPREDKRVLIVRATNKLLPASAHRPGAATERLSGPLPPPPAHRFSCGRRSPASGRYGLAEVKPAGLVIHRLTQVCCGTSSTGTQNRARLSAEILVVAAPPGREEHASDYRLWPQWARLLPHLLALAPAARSTAALRQAAILMTRYMISRGELRVALTLATGLYRDCRQRFGPDTPDTLDSAGVPAWAYRASGRHDEASQLDEHVLACRRRILGEEHPDTLLAAQHVANNLANAGHRLGTLIAASSLAEDLQALGLHEQSEDLNQDTFARVRSCLGDDHELTAHVLALLHKDHHALGDDGRMPPVL